ncbi:DUF4279 domain-containing protein [Lysinibacillus sphaericus]|uniref:DUF4279 domain-containing protein n=1 Tax=Lysinibacillus sphaericus TaxID=1421 RepID=UPI0004DF14C4|nr:DUF4279 domain-containing protein [Lysinibacillus sphaericus]QPA56947.1 DUF4279 domain-containing protein [Lysinibacillus sphaericus]
MEKPTTNIRSYFCVFGDNFPLNEFTQKIAITPTETRTKGALYTIGKTQHESYTSSWTYEIDYQRTSDPTLQINELIDIFTNKVNIINHFKKKYKLQCKIAVILVFPETSGLFINQKLIKFAYDTNSEYDIDIYRDEI